MKQKVKWNSEEYAEALKRLRRKGVDPVKPENYISKKDAEIINWNISEYIRVLEEGKKAAPVRLIKFPEIKQRPSEIPSGES